MTDQPEDELQDLLKRLADPKPPATTGTTGPRRVTRPIYLLSVDDPDERSIVLIVRTSGDGIVRATIATPEWHELEEGWDGPHAMDVAVPLADSYAEAFGYHAIAIDIESSQVWDPAWGDLSVGGPV